MNRYIYLVLWVALLIGARNSVAATRDCTAIVSGLERLACFDQVAGTAALEPPRKAPPRASEAFAWLVANERQRDPEQRGFVMSIDPEAPGSAQQRVLISAPAVEVFDDARYLVISCQADISRLQLLLERPLKRHAVSLQLLVDERAVAPPRHWRVLEDGRVIDAGRGLPAVELIRRLGQGSRISVRSDEPSLDGLQFDATGLAPMIEEERKACHW
ncbi:type VI secretion system-associated protein VasI [Pseudomonas sp. HR96]|uniref:type VI secretion system-associated protein VasI n=1 Tax=Pseudomonas sp. HR96 TaxID=1027966 RepID=UPI002A755495|nr:type VI secretion system-associated protein VasI [Pseudomonas sp. HR96]WPO98782.1 type VI secretion system-associated protein VasI [Pseudomonas sp. HR96]